MALWVFGYGSLIWNPGFEAEERQVARLEGFARSFCMRSVHHRGTESNPGLVLALDRMPGHVCAGVAFRAASSREAEVLAYLREREMISSAYREEHHGVTLSDGRVVEALSFVINRAHRQYCGELVLEEQAQIIARAHGGRGPNTEYLYNTVRHLAEMGVNDPDLDWLDRRVRAIEAGAIGPSD